MKVLRFVLVLLVMAASPAWSQATTLYSIGQPTDEEQFYLEMINRARANPTAEGVRLATTTDPSVLSALSFYDVDVDLMREEFSDLPVRPPLAMNQKLLQMARGHSQDMFTKAFQGHTSSDGRSIVQRANAVQYNYSSLAENVFSYASSVFQGHAGFQVDWGDTANEPNGDNDGMQEGRGHRMNIHGSAREAGIGIKLGNNTVGNSSVGPQLVTQNFGSQISSLAYVTGVAYYDLNENNFYDPGEGIGGLTVNVAGSANHAVTATSGGYAVPVPTTAANRAVTFSGLGLNGSTSAVVSDGNNVKVDFKPSYVTPTPVGPNVATTGDATSYTFPAVGGATGYRWQYLIVEPVVDDTADTLSRVTADTSGSYSPRSTTVKQAGTAAYRLTHPAVALSEEILMYNETFQVKPGAEFTFQSRLRTATSDQRAKVQVSTNDGGSWTDVYSQAGNGQPGEGNFQLRTVSLADYEGQQIRLRFNYSFASGSLFSGTGETLGWYVDEVRFTEMYDTSSKVETAVATGTTGFTFTPPQAGEYLLFVSPIISGRAWPLSGSLTVQVTGEGNMLQITQPPQSQVIKLGEQVVFEVQTAPTASGHQWKKNNANIRTEATGAVYVLPAVKTTDAGVYRAEVTGGIPISTQLSPPANLAVVEDIPKTVVAQEGKAVKLTVKATGPELSYEWHKDGNPLPDTNTNTLSLTGLVSGQSGTYTCEVRTGTSDPTAAATTYLKVFNDKPQLLADQGAEDGIVGGLYSHSVKISNDPAHAATSYSAKGLPAGVKINPKTGEITGRPAKPGDYTVTVMAKNSLGTSATSYQITVASYPAQLAGNYIGWVERDAAVNQALGARLDLKITALGAYSGSLTVGTKKTAFKGSLAIEADESELPHGQANIKPPGKTPGPVTEVLFYVDHAAHELHADSRVTQGAVDLPLSGWHQRWSAKAEPAIAYQILHTFGLRLPAVGGLTGIDAVPQGWGFGSFKPGADGKLKIAGRTADGEGITTASFLGPQGEVLIYQALYKTPEKGSLLGTLAVQAGAPADVGDNTVTGDVTWTRPTNGAANARLYKAGFGLPGTAIGTPVLLQAVGGSYVPPTGAEQVILNLTAGADNAEVVLEHGGLTPTVVGLNIAAKSKISPVDPALSPSGFKLAANVKTGAITGSFMLLDTPKRKVPLLGLLIRDGSDYLGAGYFLLPELPAPGLTATPILSGKMTLQD